MLLWRRERPAGGSSIPTEARYQVVNPPTGISDIPTSEDVRRADLSPRDSFRQEYLDVGYPP
jgi:hypothetical protein